MNRVVNEIEVGTRGLVEVSRVTKRFKQLKLAKQRLFLPMEAIDASAEHSSDCNCPDCYDYVAD